LESRITLACWSLMGKVLPRLLPGPTDFGAFGHRLRRHEEFVTTGLNSACCLLPGARSPKHGDPDVRGERARSRLPEIQVFPRQRAAGNHPHLPAGKGEWDIARL